MTPSGVTRRPWPVSVFAHLRVWLTAGAASGRLAVVTETGGAASVTRSAGHIWAELARSYGPSVVLLEHHPAPKDAEGAETLDLVRVGAEYWEKLDALRAELKKAGSVAPRDLTVADVINDLITHPPG
jgi:hypothetical protein